MPNSEAQLDHVVLLLPYQDIINPPDFITKNFLVSPGGRHKDGKTENRIIYFRDGTYLELIAFINDDPSKRAGHWWDKNFGVIDFALTTQHSFDYPALQERLKHSSSGVSYAEPVEGGRDALQWKVTFPQGIERGAVPFWCHDVTPRQRRVPVSDGNTDHPCGAIGLAGVQVAVADDDFERVGAALSTIVDAEAHDSGTYYVGAPNDVGMSQMPSIRLRRGASGEGEALKLTLIVQCSGKDAQTDIDESIGDGTVSIRFETESSKSDVL